MARVEHRSSLLLVLAIALTGILQAPGAKALEMFDGRLQMHGFYESQLRTISADFGEDWDVTQWYNVFNLELEVDILQDRWMGIDMLSAFVRIEARFDCIYSRGCGMFRSMNAFGNRSKSLPRRLSNGNDTTVAGVIFLSEDERLSGGNTDPVHLEDLAGFRIVSETDGQTLYDNTVAVPGLNPVTGNQAVPVFQPVVGEDCLTDWASYNGCWTGPKPFEIIFKKFEDYRFTQISNGIGGIRRMGPWLPKNFVNPLATLADAVNPFDTTSGNQVLFVGWRNEFGQRTDPDPAGNFPGTSLIRDDPIQVNVELDFGDLAFANLNNVGLPLVGELNFGAADEDGNFRQTAELAYPSIGGEGGGGGPLRPLPVVDADGMRTVSKNLTDAQKAKIANIDLTGECEQGGGVRSCYFEEIDASLTWQRGRTGIDRFRWLVSDTSDFNIKFGQEYRRRQNMLIGETCNTGELGCFANSFAETMSDQGGSLDCGPGGCGNLTLGDVIHEFFQDVNSLDCFDSEWNCADRAIPEIEAQLDALQTQGVTVTCPDRFTCSNNHDVAEYVSRFGSSYVVSSGRNDWDARGVFVPTTALQEMMETNGFSDLPTNISQSDRAWNRGASQRDEKELKEAYLDAEFLDSRLWIRAGKQSIVWGKTELFRTTDQFNPQDLALATLPSLEESRINLWALRAVYSLYEIGPLDDVRIELAFNFDDHEPNDLGGCGEPYTVNIVCELTLGAFVHGMTGIGIAGITKPPNPWDSLKGWEIGGRVEWRYGRFSFALTDFWGYDDLPTIQFLSHFSRNVDPVTGRPRRIGATGRCTTQDPITTRNGDPDNIWLTPALVAAYTGAVDNGLVDPDCLRPGPTRREAYLTNDGNPIFSVREIDGGEPDDFGLGIDDEEFDAIPVNNSYRAFMDGNALTDHSANLNFFTWICASTVGFAAIDPTACATTVFGSQKLLAIGVVSQVLGALLAGQASMNRLISDPGTSKSDDFSPISLPIVSLDADRVHFRPGASQPSDLLDWGCIDPTSPSARVNKQINCGGGLNGLAFDDVAQGPLGKALTPEQEALLGCGPIYGTNCDYSGIDLLNAEASAMVQSFPGIEGTNESLAQLQERVRSELINQGRDPNEIKVDYFRTDGWLPILAKAGITNDAEGRIYGIQPGTARYREAGFAGPVCTTNDLAGHERGSGMLPGCRGLLGRPSDPFPAAPADFFLYDLRLDGWAKVTDSPNVTSKGVNQLGFRSDLGYYADPDFFLYHPYDPTGAYPTAICKPGGGDDCSNALDQAGIVDSPDLHNRWDNGYNINQDGNPFPLRLESRQGARAAAYPTNGNPDQRGEVRLPGAIDWGGLNQQLDGVPTGNNIQEINWINQKRDRVTPTCPDCREVNAGKLRAGFRDNNWSEWYPHKLTAGPQSDELRSGLGEGHPFTGDVFASEMAGFSWNFLMMLVLFDGDNQKIVKTIGGGPIINATHAPEDRYKFLEDCHPIIGADPNDPSPPIAVIDACLAERRRFVTHYMMSGDEWGTRTRNPDLAPENDPFFYEDAVLGKFTPKASLPNNETNETGRWATLTIDYDYSENKFVGRPILEPETRVETGEFIQAGAHCSFVTPQNCEVIQNIFAIAGVKHRTLEAGGNGQFGRRTFIWQSGGEAYLKYNRRNVLGFAVDFAEDMTKSNWGVEFTWINDLTMTDLGAPDFQTEVDEFNLTISMDRPTFINFLNPNRTFFLNTQWFIQYRSGYRNTMAANGPWNVLGLFFIQTGYFQDRLLPSAVFVYDVKSNSGAALPQITYRYSENFSVTLGAAWFMGREQLRDIPVTGIGPASNQQGEFAYQVAVENAIAIVRDRDELFLRLRYTF